MLSHSSAPLYGKSDKKGLTNEPWKFESIFYSFNRPNIEEIESRFLPKTFSKSFEGHIYKIFLYIYYNKIALSFIRLT